MSCLSFVSRCSPDVLVQIREIGLQRESRIRNLNLMRTYSVLLESGWGHLSLSQCYTPNSRIKTPTLTQLGAEPLSLPLSIWTVLAEHTDLYALIS